MAIDTDVALSVEGLSVHHIEAVQKCASRANAELDFVTVDRNSGMATVAGNTEAFFDALNAAADDSETQLPTSVYEETHDKFHEAYMDATAESS